MGSTVSHETYLSTNTDIYDGNRYSATFKEDYFASGACRYAFKGTLSGSGRRKGSDCVTKVFKDEFAKNFVQIAPDLAASKKAFGFAQEFAKEYMPKIRNRVRENEIEFLIPLIAKMKNIKHFDFLWWFPILADERYVQLYEYVAIEPYIVGDYDKFNSNSGYEKKIHELMTAFCHWTYYISGHKYMVCDLQGVKTKTKYMLTDPAVHSHDCCFGPTDLGFPGMEMVLAKHACNSLCKELGLDNPLTGTDIQGAGRRPTTYSFQVTEEQKMRANRGKSDYINIMSPIFE